MKAKFHLEKSCLWAAASSSKQQLVCPNPSIGTIRQGAQRLSTQHATRTPGNLAKIGFFRRLIKPRCFSHNVALCKHRKQPRPHSLIDWFYPQPPAQRSGARCSCSACSRAVSSVQTDNPTGASYSWIDYQWITAKLASLCRRSQLRSNIKTPNNVLVTQV